jgi:hypothetical protein
VSVPQVPANSEIGTARAPRGSTAHTAMIPLTELIDPVAMTSRFFFHLVRGPVRIVDRTGTELKSEVLMRPAVFDVVKDRWPGIFEDNEWQGWTVEITDAEGRIVRTISLL